jgi:hypothetical protein
MMVAPMIAARGESHNVAGKRIVLIQFLHGETKKLMMFFTFLELNLTS